MKSCSCLKCMAVLHLWRGHSDDAKSACFNGMKIKIIEVRSWSPEIIPANPWVPVGPSLASSFNLNMHLFTCVLSLIHLSLRTPLTPSLGLFLLFCHPLIGIWFLASPALVRSLYSQICLCWFIQFSVTELSANGCLPKECHIQGKPKLHSSCLSRYQMLFPLPCPDHILPCIAIHSTVWHPPEISFPLKRVRYHREHLEFFCDIPNSCFVCGEFSRLNISW